MTSGLTNQGERTKEESTSAVCPVPEPELLRSPGIDSKESIPPAYAAWWAGKITIFLFGS
jgi:hypothetical protein